jgi:hypothetical protein
MVLDKKKKIILVSVGIVLLGVIIINKWLKNLPKATNPDLPPVIGAVADKNKVLKLGSKGLEVGLLQKALGSLQVDGIFGAKTEARLKDVKGVSEITLNELK